VDPASVETIYLGVDDRFGPQPHDEQESVRARYQLPREFLLYFGSNKPHKNLVRLIDAYAILHAAWCEERDSIPPLVIAGAWDATHPEAKIRAKNLGLDAQVRFLGPIADFELPALYSAATAFLFPSQYEGFGLPVLEAMACGTPVACSHTSSLPEVAGEAALYFEPDDKESIAQAMLALLSDPPLRAKLSDLGRRRAASFSWRTTARKTIELYRSLLQRRRAKGNR
jgi:alpha-1,3-rhamnosyl/mannosyltransferase